MGWRVDRGGRGRVAKEGDEGGGRESEAANFITSLLYRGAD